LDDLIILLVHHGENVSHVSWETPRMLTHRVCDNKSESCQQQRVAQPLERLDARFELLSFRSFNPED
jgi:hypothetical protein